MYSPYSVRLCSWNRDRPVAYLSSLHPAMPAMVVTSSLTSPSNRTAASAGVTKLVLIPAYRGSSPERKSKPENRSWYRS